MDISERIDRITKMEEILDIHSAEVEKFRRALEEFRESCRQFAALEEYYGNTEYFADIESYDKGELPADMKCGVLSEDAVFDLMRERYNTAIEMLEAATEIIRNN